MMKEIRPASGRRTRRRAGLTGWIAVVLSFLLSPGPAMGAVLARQAEGEPLRIVVLEGEGSINNVREMTMRSPVVRVEDATGKPVAGAIVSFTTPAMGASAIFVDGGTQASVTTDEKGIARIQGMRPNNVVGNFEIRVTATSGGNRAAARIAQTNAAPVAQTSSGGGKGVLIGVLLAVAGGVGVAVAMSGGGSKSSGSPSTPPVTPPAPSVTITAGTPGFSAP